MEQVTQHKAKLKAGLDIWPEVSESFSARTPKQCKERYSHHLQPDVNKAPWGSREESLLFHLQATIGEARLFSSYVWRLIVITVLVAVVPCNTTRAPLSVRTTHTAGNCWTDIARALPGRSDCACKNRYYSALRRVERALRAVPGSGGGGGAAMATTLMTAISRSSMATVDWDRVVKVLKKMGGR